MSIDYEPEGKVFNMFLKIYFDDFLLDSGLGADGGHKLVFKDSDEFTSVFLTDYVNEKVRIMVNGNPVKAEPVKMDLSDNELRMNLSFGSDAKVRSITVKNSIMTSIYSDQANMLIVRVNDFEEGARLTALENEKTFDIQ
jgi:translation elongation factor P/translation initiation factor 5A